MFSNACVPVNLALCYLSVLTRDPPHGSRTLPCCRLLLMTVPAFGLCSACFFCTMYIPPDIGMAHFLTICLTIILLMRISLTFLTPYLILYRYLYFLYLIFPHRTQHFLTCHLLHCLLQAEYKCQQDKHFCRFSLPRLSPAPRTMRRSEKVLNKYLINE